MQEAIDRRLCSAHRDHLPEGQCKCSQLGGAKLTLPGLDVRLFANRDPTNPLVIYCHGNKRNICSCHRVIEFLKPHFNLVIFDYMGFGMSKDTLDGYPTLYSPEALANDVGLVIRHLQTALPTTKLYVYAHSLGTGIALRSLSKLNVPISGLILEGAFASLSSCLTGSWLGWVASWPVWWLVDHKYPNAELITRVRVPTMLVHSSDDHVVPFSESEKLLALLPSAQDRLRGIYRLTGPHNGPTYDKAYARALELFVK